MDNTGSFDEPPPTVIGKSRQLGMGSTMVELMMPNVYTERIEGFIKFIPEDFVVNEIDNSGHIVVARRTARAQIAALALEHQRSRTSGETFLKLRKVGNLMGTMKYPSNIFTEEDTIRLDALLDHLVSHMSDKEAPSLSHKKPPFCIVALRDSENPKDIRTKAHAFIRENLPFLDSVAQPLTKLREIMHDKCISKMYFTDVEDDCKLFIKVFPKVECVKTIENIRQGTDDWVKNVLKDMPPCTMPTVEGVVKHLDLTDYSCFPEDYKEKQKLKQYLHFNVQKRDRSTHEITNMLCRTLHRSSHDIFTAGNKDRRAITTQRFCIRRAKIEDFLGAMTHPKWLDSVVVADFKYSPDRLKLGDLRGNTFWVTIRGISDVKQALTNLESLRYNGFLNYFGLQRFGSLHVGTHVVGAAMLRRDYETVVRLIVNNDELVDKYLSARKAKEAEATNNHSNNVTTAEEVVYSEAPIDNPPENRTNKRRRTGNNQNKDNIDTNIDVDNDTTVKDEEENISFDPSVGNQDCDSVFKLAPKISFIERDLMNGLERNKPVEDVLRRIPTNVLSIYVHAAQSLVFNFVLTERVKRYGMKPVVGDLVVRSSQLPLTTSVEGESIDCSDEAQEIKLFPHNMEPEAYVVTPEDLDMWSIYDVVLPLPGDNVEYPEFLKPVYERVVNEEFGMPLEMFSTIIENLPEHLKGRERCMVGVGGGYRHIVARAHGLQYHIVPELARTVGHMENLPPYIRLKNQTRYPGSTEPHAINSGSQSKNEAEMFEMNYKLVTRCTLVVSCALPKSCYLTCALREVLSDESLERQYIG
ncbi:tRNA pseudouridine synthase D (TruD) family protein [Babesia bovis T2Bo]|uniref:tRNA pseudouridine synthase D (TruD) domain containing protein n=1 Tax=Babesia bovis TaxID=5865 RepID=A7AX66_BABBO|nr:tRNA pseudouridine synthase D (TruD) family protein [Babesia bovis T2Bo]EDO05139.1 tRNA pseudouridine synthase D (TruD) family protein [Babesia bovis T2Bo]|eukprot:XP_001608707.1 tRNA pseudouridine synthase D (TruD) domain containing protein [Babesia bovis T2Bo]